MSATDSKSESPKPIWHGVLRPHPPRKATEAELARLRGYRANRAYFDEHRTEITEAHPDQFVVIAGEQEVHVFEKRSEMFSFLQDLKPPIKGTAYLAPSWKRPGYSTGVVRVIRP